MFYFKNRVQMFDGQQKRWVKYDTRTGAMMQTRNDGKPFKRVKKA